MAGPRGQEILVGTTLDFKELVAENRPLSFLAGAGISMDPPACLASARQLIDALVTFGAPTDARDGLLAIRQLRYEMLVQLFRDVYDPKMEFSRYFETATIPNRIHHFLANMARKHNVVVTTNFDCLIETAVMLQGVQPRVVITKDDFEAAGDPVSNAATNRVAIYKIHGSPRNITTGEDTRGSVVSTLDALGKHKGGDVFALETFKRSFFDKACNGRTLVVLGYSGGDDLDLVPTLLRMSGLARVIWISHVQDKNAGVKTYKVDPSVDREAIDGQNDAPENLILYKLARLGHVDVFKIVAHTGALIEFVDGNQAIQPTGTTTGTPGALGWLAKTFAEPKRSTKEYFAAMLYQGYNRYTSAIGHFKRAMALYEEDGDDENAAYQLVNLGAMHVQTGQVEEAREFLQSAMARAKAGGYKRQEAMILLNLGNLFMVTGDPRSGLEYMQRALAYNEEMHNEHETGSIWNNIGVLHMNTGALDAAINAFNNTIAISERLGNLEGMAAAFSNKGAIYQKKGEIDKAYEAHEQSISLARKLGLHEGIALNLGNMGLIMRQRGDLDGAAALHEEAIDLYEGLGVMQGIAQNLGGLGLTRLAAKRWDDAREAFTRALEIETKLGNLHGQAIQLGYLGHLHVCLEMHDDAISCYQKALEIDERLGYMDRVAGDLMALTVIRIKIGPMDVALKLYERARAMFESMGNTRMVTMIDKAMQPVKKLLEPGEP